MQVHLYERTRQSRVLGVAAMNIFEDPPDKGCEPGQEYVQPGNTDIKVQFVLSLALGVMAFLGFCVRTRTTP